MFSDQFCCESKATLKNYRHLVAKSCLTLCDPMDYNPPGSSVHGISIQEWIAILIVIWLL